MNTEERINWLLQGDVSLQYQTFRDLLDTERTDLQERIEHEGWGAAYLAKRRPDGHWGQKFYQPKWISSHYTLLDLRNLWMSPRQAQVRATIKMIALQEKGKDGGINPAGSIALSDVCINGMFLNYASYFGAEEDVLKSIVDYILTQQLRDGGFNCMFNRSGAKHSSLHSTLSVLEGISGYLSSGYSYKCDALREVEKAAQEFILQHQLYISDRTGKVIRQDFLRLSYPGRWYYDILRALDYFRYAKAAWDPRMQAAIDMLLRKRTRDGCWKLQSNHPGAVHFQMEEVGKPSRWNTLRTLRVFRHFDVT